MPVTIEPDVRRQEQLLPTLEHADAYLRNLIGEDLDKVKVEWTSARDERNRPTLGLRLTDYVSSVSTQFPADHLTDWFRVEGILERVWSDLLSRRSKYHLQRLQKMLAETPEE